MMKWTRVEGKKRAACCQCFFLLPADPFFVISRSTKLSQRREFRSEQGGNMLLSNPLEEEEEEEITMARKFSEGTFYPGRSTFATLGVSWILLYPDFQCHHLGSERCKSSNQQNFQTYAPSAQKIGRKRSYTLCLRGNFMHRIFFHPRWHARDVLFRPSANSMPGIKCFGFPPPMKYTTQHIAS